MPILTAILGYPPLDNPEVYTVNVTTLASCGSNLIGWGFLGLGRLAAGENGRITTLNG
jgi:hypothetical protein